jgi:capsular exopolysaccharide synthesis family protein
MSHIAPYTGEANLARAVASQAESSHGSYDVERIYHGLRKRWRLFLAIVGGVVALVAIATMLTPKSYTTTVRLLVGRPGTDVAPTGNDTALPVLNALVLQSGTQSAETLAVLAQQHDIAAKVIAQLNLQTTPGALLGRVSVKPVVNTALLNLSVKWRNAESSAQIANAFGDAFVDQEREFVRSEAVAAIGFLSQELPRARARMQDAASRLARFQSTHGYIDATAHEQAVVSRADSIDQRIDQLSVDMSEAKAQLASDDAQLAALSQTVDSAKNVAQNPVAADLRSKLATVETELAEAQQRYTPVHPAVIALRQQRAALLAQLAAQPQAIVSQTTVAPNPLYQTLEQNAATYRARIQGDEGQLAALKAQRQAYRPAIMGMPAQAVAFGTVSEEAKRAANVYSALEQKYNDAVVAKATAISDIIDIQAASAAAAVRSPRLVVNLGIGLVLGLLLGLTVIYVLDLLDRRATDKDLSALFGLPVIARIPAFDAANVRALPWLQSLTLEAFLHLCVTLKLRTARPLKTLAILSARRAEGKSTVAYNLAKSLATMQPGILLIDADLRQPTLHEKSGCPNDLGLNDVLQGTVSLDGAVQHVGAGLDILTARPDVASPVVLLQTPFETLLEEARRMYSMVIVDAPALAAVSDALLIASQMDGSLVVVGADRTAESDTQRVVAQMRLIGINNIIGIVVNRDTITTNDYGDYLSGMKIALTSGSV